MTEAERRLWLSRAMGEYGTCLMRMAYLHLGDFALAEDAVQETFIKAYSHLDRFRGESNEKTWLMRIAINTCISMQRTSWMRMLRHSIPVDSVGNVGTADHYKDDTVIKAVQELPNKLKQAVLLYYYQELSVAEIADVLNIPVPTAQSRLKRGRDKLRTVLKEWYSMKNRLKMELDNRLSAVNWHGESKVWSQIHSKSTTERRIGRRSAILAAAVLMVFSVSAVAAFMLQYSPQQDMRMQAHSALNAKYGMTEEVVALFNETVTVDGSEWEANYELPVYGELAGSYSVVCENGKIDVLWSHDGETYSPDGDLSSAVWGVPQLVRMQKLYQTRTAEIAHWEENGGYDTLSIAQKAEIDAPLLELPYSVDSIHIMPSEDDIQQDKAEMLAREEILRRFGGDATALDNCEIRITFMQTNEARRYDLRFLMDGQVHYHVQLLSPTGQIVECRRFDWQGLTTDEAEALDDTAMSIEDRAALHEQMRKDGGDMQRWNSVLPEDGDINEAEAIHIAQEALHEQFGISAENLAGMDKEIYCRMD